MATTGITVHGIGLHKVLLGLLLFATPNPPPHVKNISWALWVCAQHNVEIKPCISQRTITAFFEIEFRFGAFRVPKSAYALLSTCFPGP